MSDQLKEGENVVIEKVQNPKAVLEAQLKQFSAEQAGRFEELPPATPTAATPVQEPTPVPPPVKTPEQNKTDSLQQFRDKEGNVDPSRIEKSNENLQKASQDKEARLAELLKQNKELQRKFTKESQKLSEATKMASGPVETPAPQIIDGLTPELRKQIVEDLEKDLPGTLVRLSRMAVAPLEERVMARERESKDLGHAQELDSLVEQGHGWIISEGLERFNQTFAERPWLLQSRTPYKDALRFMSAPVAQSPAPAPGGMRTPILGANHAVPPPSSQAPVSPEQELSLLKGQLESAIHRKDKKAQQEIMMKMDEAQRNAYPSTWY